MTINDVSLRIGASFATLPSSTTDDILRQKVHARASFKHDFSVGLTAGSFAFLMFRVTTAVSRFQTALSLVEIRVPF